jgi:hypothetical protein
MLKPNASVFCPPPTQPADWARHEFAGAQLPDRRLDERLCMIATAFAEEPTASIPQACGPGAGSKGAYRCFENESIAPHTIRQAHHQATLARVRPQAVVLAIQDTPALNYSTHPQTQGLGPLGSHSEKTIGLFLHSTLAVTPTGQPLGLLHSAVRARDPKARGVARQRHRKPGAQKESQQWLDSLSACPAWAAKCPDTLLVNLTDREGDLYELFAQALGPTDGPRVHVLVRSRHNRRLQDRELRLWDAVSRAPLAGHLKVRVGRRGEQPARLATLSIRFSPVTLAPPGRKADQPLLGVWAVEAREGRPPKGVTPIRWQLVTTLPVTCAEEALEKVAWYAQRWQIEVLHKVLKRGGQIEQRQLETAARLERALSVDLVVAWRLTEYCDQNHLSTKERLDLFIKVCQAIQHAHQKGIIHRDIKPSNTLVTLLDGVPAPKVIDFGIAKATEGRLTDATVYTQLHQFIGTPAYMSPEQAEMSGLDIDTRSDIYSLGELLAGSTPFDTSELMSQGIDAMRKTIREKEPPRLSTRFATLKGEELTTTAKRRSPDKSKLMHQLKGDMDWIVMKCLEKDRTRRYETANGLAADLKRHLNNEPIVARPPSSAYRFQKLVRRNKLAFAAAGAVAAALVVGLGISTSLYVKAHQAYLRALAARREADVAREDESRQRHEADAARSQAEGLVTFMIQDLQPALKDYGRLSLPKQVDEKTVDYFATLPPDLHNAGTELGRADAITALAEILQTSGDTKSAAAKLQEALDLY